MRFNLLQLFDTMTASSFGISFAVGIARLSDLAHSQRSPWTPEWMDHNHIGLSFAATCYFFIAFMLWIDRRRIAARCAWGAKPRCLK